MQEDILNIFLNIWKEHSNDVGTAFPPAFELVHAINACMLARILSDKYDLDDEISQITCLFHDIGRIMTCKNENHAETGSILIKEILFDKIKEEDLSKISYAIFNHSNKDDEDDDRLSEFVKDVDVFNSYILGYMSDKPSCKKRLHKIADLLRYNIK